MNKQYTFLNRIKNLASQLLPEYEDFRISKPINIMFIIGRNKCNTKHLPCVHTDHNGKIIHFDYWVETTLASGETEEELIKDIKKYVALKDMNMYQLLNIKEGTV